jgi:hypothetical protein
MFCAFVSNTFGMNYLELKNTLHKMIDQVDDPEVLYAIRDLLNQPLAPDFMDTLVILTL